MKKILAIILSGFVILGVYGCGADKTNQEEEIITSEKSNDNSVKQKQEKEEEKTVENEQSPLDKAKKSAYKKAKKYADEYGLVAETPRKYDENDTSFLIGVPVSDPEIGGGAINLYKVNKNSSEAVFIVATQDIEYSLENLDENFNDMSNVTIYEENSTSSDELSETQLIRIAKEKLEVPDNQGITYTIGNKLYWEAGETYYYSVSFYENGETVASANVDAESGELLSNIMGYLPNE